MMIKSFSFFSISYHIFEQRQNFVFLNTVKGQTVQEVWRQFKKKTKNKQNTKTQKQNQNNKTIIYRK